MMCATFPYLLSHLLGQVPLLYGGNTTRERDRCTTEGLGAGPAGACRKQPGGCPGQGGSARCRGGGGGRHGQIAGHSCSGRSRCPSLWYWPPRAYTLPFSSSTPSRGRLVPVP